MTWRAGKAEPHGTRVVTDTGGSVAWVPTVSSSEAAHCVSAEEAHRRAVLIAASEDLLAALKGLDEAYCRAGSGLTKQERHEDRMRLMAARAAIARATGGKT